MRLSFFVSTLAWLSTFALAWLILAGKVPASATAWGFFAFFLITAALAGLQSSR